MLLVVELTVRRDALEAFRRLEHVAARIMARHGGTIERALCLEEPGPTIRELHIVRFASPEGFAAYRADPETLALATDRAQAIEATQIWPAGEGPEYGRAT